MRNHDWTASSLGPAAQWPQALQTLVGLMLRSKEPAFLAWGPELCMLYNDAYADILGPHRHPEALGQPLYAVWPEIRADLEPLVNQTLAGEAVHLENMPLVLQHRGINEEAYFSFFYTPVDGPDGQVAGFYATVTETTAQVMAEKNHQTEMQWLYGMFEHAPSFMAVVREPEHVYVLANRAYLQLVGHDDIAGKAFRQLGRKQDGPDYGALLDEVRATGKPFIGTRMPLVFDRQGDGQPELHLIDFVFQPIVGSDGTVTAIFIEGNDVTEHARAEDELRDSRRSAQETAQRLDAVLQAAPVGIMLVDNEGTLLRTNPAYRKVWGNHPLTRKAGDFVEWKAWWADHSDRHGRRLELDDWALARALRGQDEAPRHLIEIEPFGQPNTRRTLLNCGAPVRDAQGGIIGAVVAQMDITEQVRNEAALRETVLMYRTIANAIPQMVWAAQTDGLVDYVNQQWHDYTGAPHGAAESEAWQQLIHPEERDAAAQKWQHSLVTGQVYELEHRLRHHSGQHRWVLARAQPVRNAQGVMIRWIGTCTDIHDQKLAQQKVLHADRLKDEFLAMLAHELRNPLAPIATAADLLARSAPGVGSDPAVRPLSEVISRQARHMTRLIDDLLDVSRVTRGQVTLDKKPVDLNTIANEALEQIRPLLQSKAHQLDIELPPEATLVMGDKPRLVQVLVNVLGNAIRYTPNGGRISLQMQDEGGQLMIRVRDNGIGMSSELMEVAFELFTQGDRSADRSQGGLGIGLALVRSLVLLHGGSVSLSSNGKGLGSEVTVVLPRLTQDGEERRADKGDAPGRPAGGPLRVLVVDDNVDAARLLGMFIEMLGHEVFVQFHPANALECARRELPDVCLLDIGLPDMDGYTLARQLRLIPGMQTTIMAAVTGYSQPRDKQAAFAVGFNFHFAKPIDSAQLESWIQQVAEQPMHPAGQLATSVAFGA